MKIGFFNSYGPGEVPGFTGGGTPPVVEATSNFS